MKRIGNLLLTLILLTGVFFMDAMATEPESPVLDGATLVTFGDSLTASSEWSRQLAAQLNMRLINAGVGGDTTAMARVRFERDVLGRNPDFVTIAFGTNDFFRPDRRGPYVSLDDFRDNLRYFIERVRQVGAVPILLTIPYMVSWGEFDRNYANDGGVMAVLDTYNDVIRQLAAEHNVPLADIRAACDDHDINEFLSEDGIHLAALGQQVYAETVAAVMITYFEQEPNASRVFQGPRPAIIRGAQSVPLISLQPADWMSAADGAVVFNEAQDGALTMHNTTGEWPVAHYQLPDDGIAVPLDGTRIEYDITLGRGVGANIILVFGGASSFAVAWDLHESLNPHFQDARFDGDDLAANQTLTGSFALSDLEIIHRHADDDGFVTLNGIRLFVVGGANQEITFRRFDITTDGGGHKEYLPYEPEYQGESTETEPGNQGEDADISAGQDKENNIVLWVIGGIAALVALAVGAAVGIIVKKKK
ncbi:MAG: SGNH/GDSL hydrolase family protein [Oscillospiraceae bacterium]|nr:SGNH/GDSL hydrolase family protein [Oscillospiraceae bacterium]